MRGADQRSGSLFSYVDLEERVLADHPLRTMREIANAALGALSGQSGPSTPQASAVLRSRLRGCCGRCCCRLSTTSALDAPDHG